MAGDLSRQPAYVDTNWRMPFDMPNTKTLLNNAFFIGCHPFVTSDQEEKIINSFNEFMLNVEGNI